MMDRMCSVRAAYMTQALVVTLSLFSWVSADTRVSPSQIDALMSLKTSLQGNKTHLSTWNETNECSEWKGLTCDDQGFVVEIQLYSSESPLPRTNYEMPGYVPPFNTSYSLDSVQLSGNISESIGNLTSLKKLFISGNLLSGGIPDSIGNLVNLEILDLSSNFLKGSIPSSISKLKKLRLLFLSYNSLNGPIPEEIGELTKLKSLDLSTNYLSGSVPDSLSSLENLAALILGSNDFSRSPAPAWISNLTKLKYLDIRGANLNGTIPDLRNLTNLDYVDLSFNGLSGFMSNQFSNLTSLQTMILAVNSISGPIPPALGRLPLSSIDLSRNKLFGGIPEDFGRLSEKLFLLDLTTNQLNGTIPSSIGNLSSLNALSFGSNRLTGNIPDSIVVLPLYDLFLEGNSLTGQIPLEISKISLLNNIVLSHNQLSGPLPNNISQLTDLISLILDNNTFSGQLPPEFDELISLEVLDASNNIFTGIIPPSYGKLGNLTNLRLFQNSLQGTIPDLSNLTQLVELDLSLNALTGPVPNNLSPSLIKLNLRSNSLSGPIPNNFLSRLVNLTTLDLSSNMLTNIPSFNKTSSSLSYVSLASSQFSPDSPKNFTRGDETIEIFGSDCSSDVKCINRPSDYADPFYNNNPETCAIKCNGLEKLNPVLYVDKNNCFCSPPLIVKVYLYAPLFYVFNGNESYNVRKYFAGVVGLPIIQVGLLNATVYGTTQVAFNVHLLFFTTSGNPWSSRNVSSILVSLYASDGKREDRKIGPYRVLDFIETEKGAASSETTSSKGIPVWVVVLVACISAFAILAVIIAAVIVVRFSGGQKLGKLETDVMSGMARAVRLSEVQQSTKFFSEDLLLGAGGFGSVYKGVSKTGTIWAVKRAKKVSLQSKTEFENEVKAIAHMDHINLVKLLGYCDEQNEQILIYEFMSKGTLRNALDPTRAGVTRPVLTFDERLHIAVGSATGLNYLHSGANQTIIHRDIKSENILLDSNLTAKVADFGLLKKNVMDDTENSENTKLAGTPGYMDPEYYTTYKVTTKSDVYSFGVVLLELLTGKAPIMEDRSTVKSKYDQDAVSMITVTKWAVPHIETGKVSDIIDPLLEGNYDPKAAEAFARVAFACVRKQGSQRPDMGIVAARLREILEAVRTGAEPLGHFSVVASDTDSQHILEPPIPSTHNSGVSGFYAPSDINFGR